MRRRLDGEVLLLRGRLRWLLLRGLRLRRMVHRQRGQQARRQQRHCHAAARQHAGETTGQRDHHQRIEHQQRQCTKEDRPAQVERLAMAIDIDAGIEG